MESLQALKRCLKLRIDAKLQEFENKTDWYLFRILK